MRPPRRDVLLLQIASLTTAAQAAWVALLVATAYSLVTIASQSDADTYLELKSLQLPILAVSIKPIGFLIGAPILVAMLMVYLHTIIIRLWSLYAWLPPELDGLSRGDRVAPWIATVLLPGSTSSGPLKQVARISAIGSVWIAPLIAILFVGGSYVESGTSVKIFHSIINTVCAVIAATSLWFVMRSPESISADRQGSGSSTPMLIGGCGVLLFALCIGFSITDRSRWATVTTFANPHVDLSRFNFRTRAYPSSNDGWKNFVSDKAGGVPVECREIDPETGSPISDECQSSLQEWTTKRIKQTQKFFYVIDWKYRDLSEIDFSGAVLEGAELSGADLTRANLSSAELQYADLLRAKLNGANLAFADLEGAVLAGADLSGAELTHANLSQISLSGQNNAEWPLNLNGALIIRTHVDRPWIGVSIKGAMIIGSYRAGLSEDELFKVWLERGVRREFLPFNKEPSLQSLPYSNLRVEETSGAALRFVDFRNTLPPDRMHVDLADTIHFEEVFGDASVALPAWAVRPCHWSDQLLGDIEFFGRWRGWLSSRGYNWPPSELIGNVWVGDGFEARVLAKDVIAIPPTSCGNARRTDR